MLSERAPAPVAPASASPISAFHRPYGPRVHRDEDAAPAALPPVEAPATFNSPSSAATFLASRRQKAAAAPPAATPAKEPAPEPVAPKVEPESPPSGDDASPAPEPIPDEEPNDAEPAKEPPIERPRSWSKDADDDWNALPRARQEKIAAADKAREAEIRQRINDTAERAKGVTAKEQAAEQVRTQYEGKLKSVVDVLEKEQLRDFPDIRTQADLDKMSADMERAVETDPLESLRLQARLRAWDTHQQRLQFAHNELQQSDTRKTQEAQTTWTAHVQAENELASKVIPELADKEKGPALQKRAAERLQELGFSQTELNDLASGKSKISVYDHRLQQLIKADLDLSDLKAKNLAAKKVVAAVPVVPPVQRPGVTQPRSSEASTLVKGLDSKLNNSGSFKDALALVTARRTARAR